jgi:pyrroline-5-carboxylate reductase
VLSVCTFDKLPIGPRSTGYASDVDLYHASFLGIPRDLLISKWNLPSDNCKCMMVQRNRSINLAVLGSGMNLHNKSRSCRSWLYCSWSNLIAGFMGTSILKGLLRESPEAKDGLKLSYTACVRSDASLDRLRKALGEGANTVHCQMADFTEAARKADIVMLGVPPGELVSISKTPGLAEAVKGKLIVSLLAGVSCAQMAAAFVGEVEDGKQEDYESNVAQVIPTIAAQVGDSVTLIAESKTLRREQQELCTTLFKRIGTVQHIPEDLMNEATATGVVCQVIAILAVDAAVDASVAKGLPRAAALSLAANSLRSAAGILGGEMTPEELKAAMSVPSGITINTVLKLDRANMRFAVAEAVGEAIEYTRSMA